MRNFITILIGLFVIINVIYAVVEIFQLIFGARSWDEVSSHLIGTGFILLLILLGLTFGKKKEEEVEEIENEEDSPKGNSETLKHSSYNPLEDKIHFDFYRQEFKTWWNDSDGDYHYHSTEYATLRFYEDGIVIGVRSSGYPDKEKPESYTLCGNWDTEKNKISIELDKVSDIDDSIDIYISPEDRRNMKYYGEIADDDSIIKAGRYTGVIAGKSLSLGKHSFTLVKKLKLIITAGENVCDKLERRISDHPLVISAYQNTGNWYTNGETGPEWFTLSIIAEEKHMEDIDQLIAEELANMGESAQNQFWDHA